MRRKDPKNEKDKEKENERESNKEQIKKTTTENNNFFAKRIKMPIAIIITNVQPQDISRTNKPDEMANNINACINIAVIGSTHEIRKAFIQCITNEYDNNHKVWTVTLQGMKFNLHEDNDRNYISQNRAFIGFFSVIIFMDNPKQFIRNYFSNNFGCEHVDIMGSVYQPELFMLNFEHEKMRRYEKKGTIDTLVDKEINDINNQVLEPKEAANLTKELLIDTRKINLIKENGGLYLSENQTVQNKKK